MNPSELRMMWMSQYNAERISLDEAASYYSHPTVGLSVIDEMTAQPSMDLNPMMSIVGGDFSGQAAAAAAAVAASSAAAAALSVQPTTLIAANSNDIYGLAQMGGLHQHLLQQSASAAFQNYTEIIDDDETAGATGVTVNDDMKALDNQYNSQMYDHMDDGYDESISELTPKQEIINIDDFVMMTDSNSYDGTDFMTSTDSGAIKDAHDGPIDDEDNGNGDGNENNLLQPVMSKHKSGGNSKVARSGHGASTSSASSSSSGHRSQRKTRKIEPVNRPGLVLKTPIAYKGNIDPSVIPIQKDGMAVCERCGAIGVKHTFYTKSRRFCSMSCARGELHSLINNKMTGENQQQQQQHQLQDHQQQCLDRTSSGVETTTDDISAIGDHAQQQVQSESEDSHQKSSNYRFRITDQTKITQLNGNESGMDITNHANVNNASVVSEASNEVSISNSSSPTQNTKALRMYRDVLPQDELPQIPKLERLPAPCPQMEKIISIRRRIYDPTHSYDWTPRLLQTGFYAAPVTCFPHAPGYEVWDNIGVDMKVEVENTDCDNLEIIQPGQTPHSFWVATILIISGYKALMRYEGFDDDTHDFWVNLCNAEVHSVGWCATRGKPLIPPKTIEKKYKDWKDFLVERLSGARTLPSSFYNKINDSMQSRFRIGLNLECVDKDHISQVRLATVTKIVGKRLFLRYFDSDDGFWCHEDSPIIHPVGWATTVGHNLAAPQDYLERMLAGREAMIVVHEDDATIELFKMNFTFEEYYLDGKINGFVEGMKLEAVDPLNLSSICAATVMAVLKFGYMMIRIDSYQPDAAGTDWFCYHEKSPCIFPVGFCASNGIMLTPPNGYDANAFNWDTYLQETGCIAAGEHLFHRNVPNHGFEVGMSLECADLMDPRLVCVATVARVVGRLLKIHFDGWTDEYDQWLDCESPDIYPVGWCVLVNHKLEGPPVPQQTQPKITPKTKAQKKRKKKITSPKTSENSTSVKSRTIALKTNPHLPKLSIKLELKPEHHNAVFYEETVGDMENADYEEDSNGHYSDQSTILTNVNMEKMNSGVEHTHHQNYIRTGGSTTVKKSVSPVPPTVGRKANSYIGNSAASNSKYIPRLIDSTNDGCVSNSNETQAELMPDTWNVYDVSQFLRVNDCTAYCDTFSRSKIDGKRLMQVTKDEIITLLGMKVGPALKIYDLIQQLKCKVNPGKSRLHHKANKTFL